MSTIPSSQSQRGTSLGGEWLFAVTKYLDSWEERASLSLVCKSWEGWLKARSSAPGSQFWRVMYDCLVAEGWLALEPSSSMDSRRDWRSLFLYNFDRRAFQNRARVENAKFSLRVSVRFRPPRASRLDGKRRVAPSVVMPLHQRLQLLKATTKGKAQLAEAMEKVTGRARDSGGDIRVLAPRRSRAGGPDSSSRARDAKSCPPASPSSRLKGETSRVVSVDESGGRVVMMARGVGLRGFEFDAVGDGPRGQKHVYEMGPRNLVNDFLNGFNCALFVYGQTGSGKTHTMFGPDAKAMRPVDRGVVPRAIEHVWSKVERRRAIGCTSTLGISYVEVFGNQISDLLLEGAPVAMNKAAAQRFVVSGRSEVKVKSLIHARELLDQGERWKTRAATAMNERSSRAHTLLVLRLSQTDRKTDMTVESRLILADLGGAEQTKESQVTGQRMAEAIHINLGLLALKNCIDALQDGRKFVPYGDSQLTKLLSSALGGNSKTGVIVCASKDPVNSAMTMQALRFGEQCRQIKNVAGQGRGIALSVLRSLNTEISRLEAEIKRKERWENRQVTQRDEFEGTTKVITQSYLTGAELERKELEKLIKKRDEFLG